MSPHCPALVHKSHTQTEQPRSLRLGACRFSYELIDCRGHAHGALSSGSANETWTSGCAPPHIRLLSGGLPTHRYAPALGLAAAGQKPATCRCDAGIEHLNCGAPGASLAL